MRRLADLFRIFGVILVALHVRIRALRRHPLHAKTAHLQLSCPVVRAGAGLEAVSHPGSAASLIDHAMSAYIAFLR